MKNGWKRAMAYVYIPLLFSIMGMFIVYLAAAPILKILASAGSMFIAEEVPVFSREVTSVFEEPDASSAEAQEKEIPIKEVHWPNYGEHYGNLECAQIELDVPVIFGDSNEILREGAGQSISSAIPGYGSTILISAHNMTDFLPLKNVKVGDEFIFKTSYGIYTYKVRETKILKQDDKTAYDLLQDKEELVIYTCYPFETLVGNQQDRLFVYADKVLGPELK